MRNALFFISLLMIFSIPLENTLMVPNVGTISRAIGLTLISFWGAIVLASGRVRTPHPFHMVVLLFVIWNAATVLWSVDADRSLVRMWTWVQLFGMTFVIWDLYVTRAAVRAGLQAYVLGACLAIASVVSNYLIGIEGTYQRYAATNFNPNTFGIILALGIPFALYLAVEKDGGSRNRAAGLVGLVNYVYIPAALFGIALSGTRTALLAVAPAAVFGVWSLTGLRLRYRVIVVLGITGAMFAIEPMVPLPSLERLGSTAEELRAGDLSGRVAIWRSGLLAASSRPLVGFGTGAFPSVVQGKSPHNFFVSVLVESGAIGLLLLGTVILIVVQQALAHPRLASRFWVSSLLALLIGAAALNTEHKKYTWLILSMTVASASAGRSRSSVRDASLRANHKASNQGASLRFQAGGENEAHCSGMLRSCLSSSCRAFSTTSVTGAT